MIPKKGWVNASPNHRAGLRVEWFYIMIDPRSLRQVSDTAAEQKAAQARREREAKHPVEKQRFAAAFPALFKRFLSVLERYVEAAAQSGIHSAVVLQGEGHNMVDVPLGQADNQAMRALSDEANSLIRQIVELNLGNSEPGRWESFGSLPFYYGGISVEDFSKRIADYFESMKFQVENRIVKHLSPNIITYYAGELKLSW